MQVRVSIYKSLAMDHVGRIVGSWVDGDDTSGVFIDWFFWMDPPELPREGELSTPPKIRGRVRTAEDQRRLLAQFGRDLRATSPHLRP